MATSEYELSDAPDSTADHELWLQHAAGFILFEDARQYALDNLDPNLDAETLKVVTAGIDDAIYGLMMIIDGASGGLSNTTDRVELDILVRHLRRGDERENVVRELRLADGEGMCMGYHGWLEGDFGRAELVKPTSE